MEWEDIGNDQFVNVETGEIHLCTINDCNEIVSDGTHSYCQLTGRAFSSGKSLRIDETRGSKALKILSHVRHPKQEAVILEETQRNLAEYFDRSIFPVPSDVSAIKALFGRRLMQRRISQKETIVDLFLNWRFTEKERDFWIKHAMALFHSFPETNLKAEHFLVCLLSFAADPNGLVVDDVLHIAPNHKVMMRFPLPGEILKMDSIECSVLTRGKKYLQFADWSLYPYAQIQL